MHTWTDLIRSERAAQAFGCGELQNLEVPPWPEGGAGAEGCNGCWCVLLNKLLEQLARLQEEITRMRGKWESEREADRSNSELIHANWQFPPKSLLGVEAKPFSH